MTMNYMMNAKIDELARLMEMQSQLKEAIEEVQNELKLFMVANDVDEMVSDFGHKVTFREVKSNRFDSTSFKKRFPDMYMAYLKSTMYKRFTFNA